MISQETLINWLNREAINKNRKTINKSNKRGDFLEKIEKTKNNIAGKEITEKEYEDCKEYVNHPEHYNNKYECIDVMEDVFGQEATFNFCLLNAFKYLYRCLRKHNSPTEDIKKAIWYLNKTLQLENPSCTQNCNNTQNCTQNCNSNKDCNKE